MYVRIKKKYCNLNGKAYRFIALKWRGYNKSEYIYNSEIYIYLYIFIIYTYIYIIKILEINITQIVKIDIYL